MGKLEFSGETFLIDGKRFGRRPRYPYEHRKTEIRAALVCQCLMERILDLTVTEFKVRLTGDESKNFLSREDGSGSALFRSGYATFLNLPRGYYKMTLTGYAAS